jgi:TonB family protein
MNPFLLILGAAFATAACAQPKITDQCPNAVAALSVTFPLDLPYKVTSGEATVGFTINADGSVSDVSATSTSDPAFASPAASAINRLSCSPRPVPERFSLPVSFLKPRGVSEARCPNLRKIFEDTRFERRLLLRGINKGSAVLEFTLQSSGQPTDFTVLRASSPGFASEAITLYEGLKCSASDAPERVRAPAAFNIVGGLPP